MLLKPAGSPRLSDAVGHDNNLGVMRQAQSSKTEDHVSFDSANSANTPYLLANGRKFCRKLLVRSISCRKCVGGMRGS